MARFATKSAKVLQVEANERKKALDESVNSIPSPTLRDFIQTYLDKSKSELPIFVKFQFQLLNVIAVHGDLHKDKVTSYLDSDLVPLIRAILAIRPKLKEMKSSSLLSAIGTNYELWQRKLGELGTNGSSTETYTDYDPCADLLYPAVKSQSKSDSRNPNPFDKLSEVYESTNDVIDLQSLPAQVILGNEIKDCLLTLVDEADSLYYCDLLQDHVVLDDQGNITFKGQFIGNLVSDALV